MATVTGMTAAAMQAIRDGSITGADFDSANHLILTKHDGTQLDAGIIGPATTTLAGAVELATSAETVTGTDTTRAVTPAGLASLPGYRVQLLASNQLPESALPGSWPYGISMQNCTTSSGWSLMNGFGTVVTDSISTDRTFQTFYSSNGGTSPVLAWMRTYHSSTGGGGWTQWQQINVVNNLSAASFTQTSLFTAYPLGESRIYYTTANSSAWDFTGNAGEVDTYSDGVYARQIYTKHVGGASTPVRWFRTANAASGWTAWQAIITDPGAWLTYTPVWTTNTGVGTPSLGNAVVDCRYFKIGRKVDVKFEIAFGSTTNFGTGGTGDNYRFTLPVSSARTGDSLGFVELTQDGSNIVIGRAKGSTSTTFSVVLSTGRPNSVAFNNIGDIDAVTPWLWANGHTIKGNLVYESAT